MSETDPNMVVKAIKDVIGSGRTGISPVPLHEPHFAGREWDYVRECLDTNWVSSVGKFVDRLEHDLAALCDANNAVVTVNGTAALHVALKLSGVNAEDEVLMPSLTFVATANAVSYCGAIPHFIDCEENTLGLSPAKLAARLSEVAERRADAVFNRQTGRRIGAIIAVHVLGHPCDMDALMAVAKDYDLPLVEDAAEALGSFYHGRACGALGTIGVLSFNGNKIVTAGGGGAILTNDEKLARHAKHLTTTAKKPHEWEFMHDKIGWNYRMPNLNAALAVAQLEQLDGFVSAKRRLAQHYEEAFAGVDGVEFCREPEDTKSNYWLCSILLDPSGKDDRDAILHATHAAGFLTRPVWTPMHQLDIYAQCPRVELPVTESIARRLISLPSSVILELGL